MHSRRALQGPRLSIPSPNAKYAANPEPKHDSLLLIPYKQRRQMQAHALVRGLHAFSLPTLPTRHRSSANLGAPLLIRLALPTTARPSFTNEGLTFRNAKAPNSATKAPEKRTNVQLHRKNSRPTCHRPASHCSFSYPSGKDILMTSKKRFVPIT